MKQKIAISIGDINGVGLEILLRELEHTLSVCEPIFCAHKEMFYAALQILQSRTNNKTPRLESNIAHITSLLDSMPASCFVPPESTHNLTLDALPLDTLPTITPSLLDRTSGAYSFLSFMRALELTESKNANTLLPMPIHKEAWALANIPYAGHTELLRAHYKKEAIMMLGCEAMFVALFSDHIPLAQVSGRISVESYTRFLLDFARCFRFSQALVLGFNPHCGDGGVIGGTEDIAISQAVRAANTALNDEKFVGVFPPDTAFSPRMRERFSVFVAPYHDIGLAPLKALYFDESINISLNLPITRVSVDHGVAYDIAYQGLACTKSYHNALHFALQEGLC